MDLQKLQALLKAKIQEINMEQETNITLSLDDLDVFKPLLDGLNYKSCVCVSQN